MMIIRMIQVVAWVAALLTVAILAGPLLLVGMVGSLVVNVILKKA